MKVLHLINVHAWTGPADYVIKISEFLIRKNVDVLVGFRTFYKGVFKEELEKAKVPYTEALKFPRGFKPKIFLEDNKNLSILIDEFKPDIIHCHNSLENIHCMILKKRGKNFNLIRTVYNLRTLKKKPFSSYLFNSNDHIVTVCRDYRNKLINIQNIPENKIKLIQGFVDIDKFSPKQREKDYFTNHYQIEKNTIKIGMVARFQEKRGHKFLIEAFKNLVDQGYNGLKLILVGRGEYKPPMQKLVRGYNLEKYVIFTGYVKDELPELLRNLDIFVLLQEGSDGTCRAVLEAMASGLPVVTVKRGALIDTVQENINGFFIDKKEDVKQLTKKLKKLIDNKELREYMGKKSREISVENFSKNIVLDKYYKFYRQITDV